MDFLFITSNENKIKEASLIIGKEVKSINIDLNEIQAIEAKDIVEKKAREAYDKIKKPVIVEDTGLHIKELNGFPGALVKWMLKSIKDDGICNLIRNKENKEAYAETCIGYFDGSNFSVFSGRIDGFISDKPRGNNGFGWDTIFIPNGFSKTFAEMSDEEKNNISMRKMAFIKFKEFIDNKDIY
ncbi:RdgB/HAM1 family non-canonical purine NTP pyrophosphatase [Candidatus Woesearchaeota archaeon]|nr:RdgB/HAM1 family non-canonical purine NTP pyrophosphatase [Candidatus Woesearchaeota archaeon]